jgi:hypothetical protein
MSFTESPSTQAFRIVYVENCSNISSQKPLFTGMYSTLDEIHERISYFIPPHPSLTIEYYNKKLGMQNRQRLADKESQLHSDLESIYVYLRSKKHMSCDICNNKK